MPKKCHGTRRCIGIKGPYCIPMTSSCGGRPRGTRGNPLCSSSSKHCPSITGYGGYCIPASSICGGRRRRPGISRRRRPAYCGGSTKSCGRSCIRDDYECHVTPIGTALKTLAMHRARTSGPALGLAARIRRRSIYRLRY